jgi:hypothetical protein
MILAQQLQGDVRLRLFICRKFGDPSLARCQDSIPSWAQANITVGLILTAFMTMYRSFSGRIEMAKKAVTKKTAVKKTAPTKSARRVIKPWTKEDIRTLKAHSKARTPAAKISKEMKRTVGALRRRAGILGIGLGERR